jgi:D-aspartate ligase
MNRIGAIVIGGHFHGLGLVRALARTGVPVVLLDHERGSAEWSRYLAAFHRCPPVGEGEALFRFLAGLSESRGCRGWVLFPTDDETVRYLSERKDRLEPLFRLTTPGWAVTRHAYDKRLTYRLARRVGVPIPKTFFPRTESDLENPAIPFPALVKPAVMRSFFLKTGKKVFRAVDRAQLVEQYRKAAQVIPSEEILIQEQIPEASRHLFSFSPFFRDGRTLARVIVQRLRQHPMDFGQASTYAVTVDLPELERLGSTVLRAMKYRGICEVEFIRDPRDGVFKLLEVNPRIWGWHTIALRAGVNLPLLAFEDQLGRTRRIDGYRIGVKWFREITDAATVAVELANRRMSLAEVFDSLKGERELAVFSWDDPLPFFGELLFAPRLWKRRGF